MHLSRAAHDDIADLGHHIDGDSLLHTLLQNQVPVVAADAAQKHGLHPLQNGKVTGKALLHRYSPLYIKFFTQAVGANQIAHIPAPVVDDGGPLRKEDREVPFVRTDTPQYRDYDLKGKKSQNRQNGHQPPLHQAQDHIEQSVRHHKSQYLTVDHLCDANQGNEEAVIDPSIGHVQCAENHTD